jgi:hypothetical protein
MQLPTNEQDRQILAEFIQTYHQRQWLRGANVIENHPERMCKTLEVAVNYKPVAEMKELLEFAHSKHIALNITVVY